MQYNPALNLSANLRKAHASGLTIPTSILDHWAEVDALDADLREATTAAPMKDAIDAARRRKLTDKHLHAAAIRQVRIDAISAAMDDAVREFQKILSGVRDELVSTVIDEVYTPALAELEDLASRVDETANVDALVRAGRAEDATALVGSEFHAMSMRRAHELVKAIADDRSLKNLRTLFRDAEAARRVINHGSPFSVASTIAAIRAGARPWLPTRGELVNVTASIEAEREAARAASRGRYGDAPHWFAPTA